MKMPENLLDMGRIGAVLSSIKIIREKVGTDVPIIGGMEDQSLLHLIFRV